MFQRGDMSRKEYGIVWIKGIVILFVVAMLFYNSFLAFVFLLPLLIAYFREGRRQWEQKKKEEILVEFKEMMLSMSNGLNAGYALENTIIIAKEDLKKLKKDGDAHLLKECDEIIKKLKMNQTLESLFLEMSERLKIEEIEQFAQVIRIAKRSGGNMIGMMKNSIRQITEAIEVKQDIAVMIASKVLEVKIMITMPFAIILYLRLSNPGYLDILYQSVLGRIVMTVCLFVVYAAYKISRKIVEITV